MKKEIALIGYGRFGKLLARHLHTRFSLLAADPALKRSDRFVRRVTTERAFQSPVIVLAVPIRKLKALLARHGRRCNPGALVIDVCSVKEAPIGWMKQYLPSSVALLGTHPLFGPDSAPDSLTHHPVILCPERISSRRLQSIRRHLTSVGLQHTDMTPADHDRLMARSLFLAQLIGRGLSEMPLPAHRATTMNYRNLIRIVTTAENDSKELFRDMYRYNRFARAIPDEVVRSFTKVAAALKDKGS
jgi:prephenate dehydrogenase